MFIENIFYMICIRAQNKDEHIYIFFVYTCLIWWVYNSFANFGDSQKEGEHKIIDIYFCPQASTNTKLVILQSEGLLWGKLGGSR